MACWVKEREVKIDLVVDGWARNHAGAQAQGNFRGLHRVVSTHIGMFGRRKACVYMCVCVWRYIGCVYIFYADCTWCLQNFSFVYPRKLECSVWARPVTTENKPCVPAHVVQCQDL